ncbi:hypothetical protein ACSTS3_20600 [Aquimarina muelleri]|uniref:hypothetical protein n=1 Tax=Aquimarina muelleri TaxID=279356 RepID=UPI003F682E3B
MKDDFKQDYDFELRLASESEIASLAEHLARKNWERTQKNKEDIELNANAPETLDIIAEEKKAILDLIKNKVLVQDYKKYKASIFVYNYIKEQNKGVIATMTLRVIKTEYGMRSLNHEEIVLNLKNLKKLVQNENLQDKGRPKGPGNRALQRTIEIDKYLESNPKKDMDNICKEFGISKSTYYRTKWWLKGKVVL